MSEMVFAYHVYGPYMSGRAVKVRLLADSDIRGAQSAIAKNMNRGDTGFDFRAAERHEGVLRMVTHVTKADTQPADFLAAASGDESKLDWIPVSLEDFSKPTGDKSFDKLFPYPRDVQMLEKIYADLHELTLEEITSVSGKLVPVSLG